MDKLGGVVGIEMDRIYDITDVFNTILDGGELRKYKEFEGVYKHVYMSYENGSMWIHRIVQDRDEMFNVVEGMWLVERDKFSVVDVLEAVCIYSTLHDSVDELRKTTLRCVAEGILKLDNSCGISSYDSVCFDDEVDCYNYLGKDFVKVEVE